MCRIKGLRLASAKASFVSGLRHEKAFRSRFPTVDKLRKRGDLQDEFVQVVPDDCILNTLHCDLQQVCIGSVGEMDIELSVWRTIEVLEFLDKVCFCCFNIGIGSTVVWKVISNWLLS